MYLSRHRVSAISPTKIFEVPLYQVVVDPGIALAKRIGAKVTVLTVLPPFHRLTTDSSASSAVGLLRRKGASPRLRATEEV